MDHVRKIQEIFDEHREQMPTGVVTDVMQQCQEAYNALPNLYKLTWTVVTSHAHVIDIEDEPNFAEVELSPTTQTLIVKAVDGLPDDEYGCKIPSMAMPNRGMILKSWVEQSMPFVMTNPNKRDYMTIIHSIVPYDQHKRVREE